MDGGRHLWFFLLPLWNKGLGGQEGGIQMLPDSSLDSSLHETEDRARRMGGICKETPL